jgi:hypothetical protein
MRPPPFVADSFTLSSFLFLYEKDAYFRCCIALDILVFAYEKYHKNDK